MGKLIKKIKPLFEKKGTDCILKIYQNDTLFSEKTIKVIEGNNIVNQISNLDKNKIGTGFTELLVMAQDFIPKNNEEYEFVFLDKEYTYLETKDRQISEGQAIVYKIVLQNK